MRSAPKFAALACALALGGLWTLGTLGRAVAQQPSRTSKSPRGGTLAKTARHEFEVFFYATGLRAFPLDSAGAPLDASGLTGTATFYHPNSPNPWFVRPLSPSAARPGQASPSLDLVLDLSTVPPTGANVAFEIARLPDPSEPRAAFTVPFEFVRTPADSGASAPPTLTGEVVPGPRYVYGAGYYGLGYYQQAGPAMAPSPSFAAPTIYSYGTSGMGSRSTHNWATGRDYPVGGMMSRPWLRPND